MAGDVEERCLRVPAAQVVGFAQVVQRQAPQVVLDPLPGIEERLQDGDRAFEVAPVWRSIIPSRRRSRPRPRPVSNASGWSRAASIVAHTPRSCTCMIRSARRGTAVSVVVSRLPRRIGANAHEPEPALSSG